MHAVYMYHMHDCEFAQKLLNVFIWPALPSETGLGQIIARSSFLKHYTAFRVGYVFNNDGIYF